MECKFHVDQKKKTATHLFMEIIFSNSTLVILYSKLISFVIAPFLMLFYDVFWRFFCAGRVPVHPHHHPHLRQRAVLLRCPPQDVRAQQAHAQEVHAVSAMIFLRDFAISMIFLRGLCNINDNLTGALNYLY